MVVMRKGRDLEKVVSLLEGELRQSGIQIKSPDFLPDKDTGTLREVDISLRGLIGSSDILAIIECRDHNKHPQDVTWIEQVISKRSSVNADKVLAVSSSKFSGPARIKAEKNNIELRTLDEINPEDVKDWFVKCQYIIIHRLHPDFIQVNFWPQNPDGQKIDTNAPIFKRKIDNRSVSFNDIWLSLPTDIIHKYVPPDGSKIRHKIILKFKNKEDRFQVSTKSGDIDIESIGIDAILWIEEEKVPPTSMKAYRNKDKDIAKIQDFRFNINGKEYALCFHQSEIDGTQQVSVIKDVEPNINKTKS
jgi:hypothetical protein